MIGRLNHVAIAVRDIAKAANVYRQTLGAQVSEPMPQPEHGVGHPWRRPGRRGSVGKPLLRKPLLAKPVLPKPVPPTTCGEAHTSFVKCNGGTRGR